MPTSPSLQPKRRVRAKATARSAPRLQKGKARARMGPSPKEEPSDLPNQRSGTLHPATASNTGKMAIVPNEIVANAPMSIPRFVKPCLTRGSVKPKSETRRLLEVVHPLVHPKAAGILQINPSTTKVLEPHPISRVRQAQHLTETTTSLALRGVEDEVLVAEAAKAQAKEKKKERTKGRKETLNHRLVLPLQDPAPLADPRVVKSATFVVPL